MLLFFFLFSCSAPKASAKKPEDKTPPASKDDDKVRVYDPKTGTYVLVPRDAVKADTVEWKPDPADPLITDKDEKEDPSGKKSRYDITLLMPLNSLSYNSFEGGVDARLARFMQYYGGMRIAASEIESRGLPVTIRSFDTEASMTRISEILKDPAVRRSDIIVGPYDKEHVESVAAFGLENDKIVISPWLPAFNIDIENPFFIQIVPGLESHAAAIMDFIGDEFRNKKIFLVARNNPTEIQRLGLFKNKSDVKIEDLIIDDESIELAKTNLHFLLDDPDGTVFVLPYYSRSDENFVNSFMRKLHADKGDKDVVVFGFPQWTGFSSLNPNYMESLSVHISSPTYINRNHSAYRSFRDKFYKQYFAMPDNQAYLGYDLLMWIASTIAMDGPDGLIKGSASEFGLASGFEMKPVYKEGLKRPSELKAPLYYENTRIRILEYKDQDFELAR